MFFIWVVSQMFSAGHHRSHGMQQQQQQDTASEHARTRDDIPRARPHAGSGFRAEVFIILEFLRRPG